MKKETVKSVREFLHKIETHIGKSSFGYLAVFRGQRDEAWPLVPGIARTPFKPPKCISRRPFIVSECTEKDPGDLSDTSAERRLLIVFRDMAAALMPRWVWSGSASEVGWKIMMVAQHYRLPTRFLDWSNNPLVALYYAVDGPSSRCSLPKGKCKFCSGGEIHDAAVFALTERDCFSIASMAWHNPRPPIYSGDLDPGLFRPPQIDGRIISQGSFLTVRKEPTEPIEANIKLVIPKKYRDEVMRELDSLGVNRRTLFPDLEGIAEYLKWNVKFWEPDPGVASKP